MAFAIQDRVAGALALALALSLNPAGAAPGGHEHHPHGDGAAADAADPHAAHKAMAKAKPSDGETVNVHLYDTALTNQDGESVRFASEVVGDRLVAITLMYTACKTICPVTSTIFSQVQERLGERLGDEVRLISLTVDPTTDTPQRLKAYSAKHHRRDGWEWLTGQKRDMDRVLEGLGAYTADFTQHPSVVLIGDGATGRWTRIFGFPSPDRLVAKIDELKQARGTTGVAAAVEVKE